mmetsp:Transcript_42297/g.101845  ORF Transcript_42297/g.101845 Transcript_42297/m.101845 type:complete len:1086 (-) Transcript_42297:44-3301(-)
MSQSLLAEALKGPSVDGDNPRSIRTTNDLDSGNLDEHEGDHNGNSHYEYNYGNDAHHHQSMSSISSSLETRKMAGARVSASSTTADLHRHHNNDTNFDHHHHDPANEDGNFDDNHSTRISISSSLASSDRILDHDHDHESDVESQDHSGSGGGTLPHHSDFTIPTSNQQKLQQQQQQRYAQNKKKDLKNKVLQPPLSVVALGGTIKHHNGNNNGRDTHNHKNRRRIIKNRINGIVNHTSRSRDDKNNATDGRRNIMSALVGTKYGALNSNRELIKKSESQKQQRSSSAHRSNNNRNPHTNGNDLPSLLGNLDDPVSPPDSSLLSPENDHSIQTISYPNPTPPDKINLPELSPIPTFDSQSPTPKMSTTVAATTMPKKNMTDSKTHSFEQKPVQARHTERPSSQVLQHAVTPLIYNNDRVNNNPEHNCAQGNRNGHDSNRSRSGRHGTMTPLSPTTVTSSPRRTWSRSNGISSHDNNNTSMIHHSHLSLDDYQGTAVHETLHAQSLLLGLAFMAVWTPNNAMAPNLTQMAFDTFDMNEAGRDLYLGSYCAMAVGVFSIPLSGGIGFMADFHSRKDLFLACVLFGALASAWTGWSNNYWSLFLARLCSGGCMSGSVPVAFSLLGDLFSKEERNAASSGLTAMMGLGILAGQVYAGVTGPKRGWQDVFFFSAILQLVTAAAIGLWVKEPVRGAKEQALQNVFESGKQYDRKLTLKGFLHTLHQNDTNRLIIWQGFLTSLPWGIVFVFLNDYLSQEKGFSVPEATFIIMLFGVGCAIGGIAGGYFGQLCIKRNRSFLPLYMAAGTFFGIFPFLVLFNSEFPNHNGAKAKIVAIIGGFVCCLPSVNIRPIIINVNPPETRGAALTAANLLVTLGRGLGPLCIVFMGSFLNTTRQTSLNVAVGGFWTISAIQLLFMMRTFPRDQDAMEEELARYARASESNSDHRNHPGGMGTSLSPIRSPTRQDSETTGLLNRIDDSVIHDDGESIVSIEDYMTSFDGTAARRSLEFVRMGIKELQEEITSMAHPCNGCEGVTSDDDSDMIVTSERIYLDDHRETNMEDGVDEEDDTDLTEEEICHRRELWLRQQEDQNR